MYKDLKCKKCQALMVEDANVGWKADEGVIERLELYCTNCSDFALERYKGVLGVESHYFESVGVLFTLNTARLLKESLRRESDRIDKELRLIPTVELKTVFKNCGCGECEPMLDGYVEDEAVGKWVCFNCGKELKEIYT